MLGGKTRKRMPWAGWSKLEPKGRQRTKMYRDCGKKCFLGTISKSDKEHPDFPICAKNTCRVSDKGLWAAYIRAKQWGHARSDYRSKGKEITYRGTRRTWMKGSRPTRKRRVYTNAARKAKRMLRDRGYDVGN